MPDIDPLSLPDGARADAGTSRSKPSVGIPVSIWAKTAPRRRPALSPAAVLWLLMRAGGMWARYGGIAAPLSPAFLLHVDETQPVAVLRAHLERGVLPDRGDADVVVALCSFAAKLPAAPRLIHELVCNLEDYVRVAHGSVNLPEWADWEFAHLSALNQQGFDPPAPPEALPEGTAGVVRADGSVELTGPCEE